MFVTVLNPVFAVGDGIPEYVFNAEVRLWPYLVVVSSLSSSDVCRLTRSRYLRRLFAQAFPD